MICGMGRITLSIIFLMNSNVFSMVIDRVGFVSKEALRSLMQHHTDGATIQLIDEILNRGYEGEMRAVKNAGSVVKCGWAFALNPEILKDLMQFSVGKTVLELAGADGDNALCLGLAGAATVYLNELVQAEVEAFEKKVRRLPTDLQKKFHALPGDCFEVLQDKKFEGLFDLIYARNILHFFLGEKRDRFVRLLNRLLKPGGRVVLTANAFNGQQASKRTTFKEPYVFQVYQVEMMDLFGRHGKPEVEKLFDEVIEVTDETYIRTLDPLNPTYEPALTFNLQGAVYHSAFNLLNKDSQDQINRLARSLIEKYSLLRLMAIRISLNKFPHVSYSAQTLQETIEHSNFKVINHHYIDNRGHIANNLAQSKTMAVTLEKLVRICAACNKIPAVSQRCSRCKNVHYCNAGCQKADWSTHKNSCK